MKVSSLIGEPRRDQTLVFWLGRGEERDDMIENRLIGKYTCNRGTYMRLEYRSHDQLVP